MEHKRRIAEKKMAWHRKQMGKWRDEKADEAEIEEKKRENKKLYGREIRNIMNDHDFSNA